MPTIHIDMMFLKVFGSKSHFLCLSIAMLSLEFFCFVFLYSSQADYSDLDYKQAKSQFISSCCSLYLWRISYWI